jgi:hypothetical protein
VYTFVDIKFSLLQWVDSCFSLAVAMGFAKLGGGENSH